VPPRVLASGPKPCGGKKNIHNARSLHENNALAAANHTARTIVAIYISSDICPWKLSVPRSRHSFSQATLSEKAIVYLSEPFSLCQMNFMTLLFSLQFVFPWNYDHCHSGLILGRRRF